MPDINLTDSYYKGIEKVDDNFPPQADGTQLYTWRFPYPISYPSTVVEADANIQWYNGQPKKFNLFFLTVNKENTVNHNSVYASLLTTSVASNISIYVKVFSIGY